MTTVPMRRFPCHIVSVVTASLVAGCAGDAPRQQVVERSERLALPGPDRAVRPWSAETAPAPSVAAAVPTPPAPAAVPAQRDYHAGLASYYWQDQMTASGERFDRRALTAAHRTLPMGSRVRVTNMKNGRTVVVRINDRGPFKPNRIIDLSEAAAEAIDMTRSGVVPVTVVRVN